MSAKEFAALAGCSPERVMRHYKAWDRAADDGLVPHFEELPPGHEVELPDADVWLTYYVSRSSAASERGAAIIEAAEAEGIRPTKALEVAENSTALRAAILADPSTARAARGPPGPRQGGPGTPDRAGPRRRAHRRPEEGRRQREPLGRPDRLRPPDRRVRADQDPVRAGRRRAEVRREAERHLSLIDELDEGEEAGEWATEAYDTLKSLVVETVEADPDLRVQERRTKFYSSLQKATKAFEELTFDDAQDFYEDDMVQQLEELRQAIGSCITALRGTRGAD